MHTVGLIMDDIFLKHSTPPSHPESPKRLKAIRAAIEVRQDLKDKILLIQPEKATEEDLLLIHTEDHIGNILNHGEGYIDSDTYISKNSPEVALYAVGAVKIAIDKIVEGQINRAFCAVRPPGHHATPERAMGFCLFNNVAIGARLCQKKGLKKVFIIDFDVHHGNGTQDAFYDDNTVFYFSTHEYPNYPFTGAETERGSGKGIGFTYNVPMKQGSGDNEYKKIYATILPECIQQFSPDIILVSAGYDIHCNDPLSSLEVSYDGIRWMVRTILHQGFPVIFCLEGGYHLPALSESVVITLEEMLK